MIVSAELLLILLALSADHSLDESTLATAIKNGDRASFKVFFDRHHEALFRFLVSRGFDHSDAEELIQTAFVLVWEKRETIREGLSLRSYLFTIAWNRALNLQRDRRKFDDAPAVSTFADAELAPSAHEELQGREVFAHLERAVAALPEKRRQVFEMCFLHGLPYKEAAEAMEISVKTVENQMGHALKSIRAALKRFL
jgi:RNA polymerase sigma-70 factor (ECF subfamily)